MDSTSTALPDTLYRKVRSLPSRPFTIPTSSTTTTTISITESLDATALGLPLETWASSTILASQLHSLPISFPPSHPLPIVELGAGTGLVGLTASHIYNQPTVLTDLPPVVPALWANIALNPAVAQGRVQAGVLDWRAPATLSVEPRPGGAQARTILNKDVKAHVLLAADTLYSTEHPALLMETVEAWLSRDGEARLVLGTAMRVAYLDELRELWERLEGIGLECVGEGRGEAREEDFDDERLVEWSVWRWKL